MEPLEQQSNDDFNFTGKYTPVVLCDALMYFIGNAQLNLHSNNTSINLIDLFPMMKQGYALNSSLLSLFSLYINFNELIQGQQVISDELMNVAFNSNIPSCFYYQEKMIPMKDAVEQELIDAPLNTFQVIQSKVPRFNPKRFQSQFLRTIQILNCFLFEGVNDPQNTLFLQNLLKEYNLLKEIAAIMRIIGRNNAELERKGQKDKITSFSNTDIYVFMQLAANNSKHILLNELIYHPDLNKLYISIIIGDIVGVFTNLNIYDPRDDEFRAYFLAIENGNTTVINLIKDNIIERNLVEREMFSGQIEQNNLARDIYTRTRSLFK